MPLRKLVSFQSFVALWLVVFSLVGLKAQNESASALAGRITDALKTKKTNWKYIAAIESAHFPLVPSEKRIIVGNWSGPESPALDILVSVYSVDSGGEAAKWLERFRDKQVAPGWTVARFQIGDEGYLSKYKNGDRFEIEFRKGGIVGRIAGDDLNIVKEFAQCIVEQIPASRDAQPVLAPEPWIAAAQDVPQIAGTWRGNSVCAVPNTPCHNEVNVYRFSEIQGEVNRYLCTASKIVDGAEVAMGSGEWTYDSSNHMLQTVTLNPTIQLKLDHDTLDGALVLPDKTIYHRIHLKKSSN